jgi:hypothetical protein
VASAWPGETVGYDLGGAIRRGRRCPPKRIARPAAGIERPGGIDFDEACSPTCAVGNSMATLDANDPST